MKKTYKTGVLALMMFFICFGLKAIDIGVGLYDGLLLRTQWSEMFFSDVVINADYSGQNGWVGDSALWDVREKITAGITPIGVIIKKGESFSAGAGLFLERRQEYKVYEYTFDYTEWSSSYSLGMNFPEIIFYDVAVEKLSLIISMYIPFINWSYDTQGELLRQETALGDIEQWKFKFGFIYWL